jgi:hypothetical protein
LTPGPAGGEKKGLEKKTSKKYLTKYRKIEYYPMRLYFQGNSGEKEVVKERSVGLKGGGDSDL